MFMHNCSFITWVYSIMHVYTIRITSPLWLPLVQVSDQSEELSILCISTAVCVCVCSPTAVITLLCHQLPIITPGSIGSIQLWKPTQSPPNIHPVPEEVSGVHSLFNTHSHTYNVYTPITILYRHKRGCVYLIFQNVTSRETRKSKMG